MRAISSLLITIQRYKIIFIYPNISAVFFKFFFNYFPMVVPLISESRSADSESPFSYCRGAVGLQFFDKRSDCVDDFASKASCDDYLNSSR